MLLGLRPGMLRRLAGVLLAVLPALGLAGDFGRLCEGQLPRPSVRVERTDNGYSVDHDLSYTELTGIGARARRHGRQHVLGLTRAEAAASMQVRMLRLTERDGGRECISPDIEVTVAYRPIMVFVGKEFPVDSCSYREILAHEMRHVDAYRKHLPRVQAVVRALLEERFKGGLLFGAQGEPERLLREEIDRRWLPLVDSEIRKVDAVQAEIDSLEEYERIEKTCGGELQKLMQIRARR